MKKRRLFLIGLVIIIGLFRFSLIDRGAQSWPDENRYDKSLTAVAALARGNLEGFAFNLLSTQGRPGDVALRLIPAGVQLLLGEVYGISLHNPESLMIPLAFNVIVSLLILLLFFRISMLLFDGQFLPSLISTAVYAFLVNSNIYIRHIVPYDLSLLCFMYSIYSVLKGMESGERISSKALVFSGLASGLGFSVYPGYYFLPALVFSLVLFGEFNNRFSGVSLRRCLVFTVSAVTVPLAFEVIGRAGGKSYYATLVNLSSTVTQGTFIEGFAFLPQYLMEVEKLVGVLLMVFVAFYILKSLVLVLTKKSLGPQKTMRFTVLIIFMGFLFHSINSVIFHKVVFYGRLIHMYFPFLVLASVSLLSGLKKTAIKRAAYGVLMATSIYSFITFSMYYANLSYPYDVLYKQGVRGEHIRADFSNMATETREKCIIFLPTPGFAENGRSIVALRDLILVNFCYYHPLGEDFTPYSPPVGYELVYRGRHFLSYPAYGYEGYTVKERKYLKERDYKVYIYERPSG
jgi:hypothetical protein